MNKKEALETWKRDDNGLVSGVDYLFNDDGSVNWRGMIKPKFLYPNREWFEIRNKPVPTSIEGLEDNQLLIQLGGVKELAKLRGFSSVKYKFHRAEDGYVVASCCINWIGNYETGFNPVVFEDAANASLDNTDQFCSKFLETIACNRAFIRSVRNFLNIHIVGADEISKNKSDPQNNSITQPSKAIPITPQNILEKVVNEKLLISSFEDFKAKYLRPLYKKGVEQNDSELIESLEKAKDWKNFKNIPAKTSRLLLKMINGNDSSPD